MPRLKRAIPFAWFLTAAEAALATHRHLKNVEPGTTRRLRELVTKSKGRPSNLTATERRELRKLVGKLDLRTLSRDIAAVASPLPFPRRRRRRR